MKCLTEREKQVLVLISKGLTAKEVATALNLSVHTIRSYTKSIMQKLDAKNITHAITISGVSYLAAATDSEARGDIAL